MFISRIFYSSQTHFNVEIFSLLIRVFWIFRLSIKFYYLNDPLRTITVLYLQSHKLSGLTTIQKRSANDFFFHIKGMHRRRNDRFSTPHAWVAFPRYEGARRSWRTRQETCGGNWIEQEMVESCCLEVLWPWCYSRSFGFTSRIVPDSRTFDEPWTLVRFY